MPAGLNKGELTVKTPDRAIKRILIVEDESIVGMAIQDKLEILGYEVPIVVDTGEEAVEEAATIQPDLVLMDINLAGEMDGIEAASQIRAHLNTPVIFLTAYADSATVERVKSTQPHGYLLKPFEENELRAAIEVALYKHQMEKRLKESEQWLATTLSSIGDAVIATDINGCIKFMNPVAEALTGWSQEQALGKASTAVFNIVNGKTRLPCDSPVAKVFKHGLTVELEDNTVLLTKEGSEVPIDDSAAPIRDEEGTIIGVVIVFRDITERKQAEEKLRQYSIELQMQNRELDAFAHTVAHDLKTPLNPIIGFADLMSRHYESVPEDLREGLQIIGKSGRKMVNIIDELLLLGQVRKAEIKVTPLSMADIVAEVQQRIEYLIADHQAEIVLPADWPPALGYGPWIEEVWVNYLSNGIKYGGRPPRLELAGDMQPNGIARFWVRDNGTGLSPEDQARLFTPFTQLDQVQIEGHGLGLSIVQRIVEKLGGQVSVSSTGVPGYGCVFSFTLPAVQNGNSSVHGTASRANAAKSDRGGKN
jgi:PAS domain S-box-containing protein